MQLICFVVGFQLIVFNMKILNSLIFLDRFHRYIFFMCLMFMCNIIVSLCNKQVKISKNKYSLDESLLKHPHEESLHDVNEMIWSDYLEDFILNQEINNRHSKQMTYVNQISNEIPMHSSQLHFMPINYHSNKKLITATGIGTPMSKSTFINKRIGEASVELENHKRPIPISTDNYPSYIPGFGNRGINNGISLQTRPYQQLTANNARFRTVSENEIYLLGAMEKLVYRVDYLESRIRRSEKLIYYLMASNKENKEKDDYREVPDFCPTNFTRINDNCYYINNFQMVNWKTANNACKTRNSHLAEFEQMSEDEDILAYLLNHPKFLGLDYWLGGLNPGLLWIWSNSAKPVNPNTNLTLIAMTGNENEILTNINDDNNSKDNKDYKIFNSENLSHNMTNIKGHGRCLRLSYNSTKHIYLYYGQECTSRQHYICEYYDKTLVNKLKKITRELKL